MPNKVKHVRGTLEDWAAHDAVIDDGEIALALTESGRYRMKIGNGVSKFSELEMFGGEVYNIDTGAAYMKHCADIRLGSCSRVTVTFPAVMDEDYYAILTFDSPTTPTTMVYPIHTIHFTGRSVTDGEFVPEGDVHYTAIMWYDGKIQCHIRGYDNA